MKQKALTICGAILVFLLALGITLYPLISNWYNEKHRSEIHTQYKEIIQQVDTSELDIEGVVTTIREIVRKKIPV